MLGAVASFVDITEQKKVEEALRRTRDELERRVSERTAQLEEAVARLEQEVTARARSAEELQQLNLSLRDQADQLRRLSSELTMVEQRERKRLALILHDNLQQLLTAARFRLEFLTRMRGAEVRGGAMAVDDLLFQAIDTFPHSHQRAVSANPVRGRPPAGPAMAGAMDGGKAGPVGRSCRARRGDPG